MRFHDGGVEDSPKKMALEHRAARRLQKALRALMIRSVARLRSPQTLLRAVAAGFLDRQRMWKIKEQFSRRLLQRVGRGFHHRRKLGDQTELGTALASLHNFLSDFTTLTLLPPEVPDAPETSCENVHLSPTSSQSPSRRASLSTSLLSVMMTSPQLPPALSGPRLMAGGTGGGGSHNNSLGSYPQPLGGSAWGGSIRSPGASVRSNGNSSSERTVLLGAAHHLSPQLSAYEDEAAAAAASPLRIPYSVRCPLLSAHGGSP